MLEEDQECPADKSTLVVADDAKIVARRNAVLDLLASGDRTPMSKDTYTAADFRGAKAEQVVLTPQVTPRWKAPHFVWAVRDELTTKLCGEGATTCDRLEQGGLRVTSTLDVGLQAIGEKWVKLATRIPHRCGKDDDPAACRRAAAKALGFDSFPDWVRNLVGKEVNNGALVALDYQTGELVTYVGSADYYSTAGNDQFQPQFDVVGQGYRQPGSAFKPFNYAVGIDDKTFTAGTMLMDSATDFGGGYTPTNADNLERGPVRVRKALQFSLNIPSVKAGLINTPEPRLRQGEGVRDGLPERHDGRRRQPRARRGRDPAGRPRDRVRHARERGQLHRPHDDPHRRGPRRHATSSTAYEPPKGEQVVSPQSAFIVTDILRENTIRAVNPYWGQFQIRDENGDYRPATLKTGTNNDAKDLNAYGYIAPPTEDGRVGRRLCPRGRRLERQQRQHAGLHAAPARLLHRCLDLRLGRAS